MPKCGLGHTLIHTAQCGGSPPVSRTFTFILNPAAGGRRGARRCRHLLTGLARLNAEVLTTQQPGQAHEWAWARRDRTDHVMVAVGGDGTAHEVGTALIDATAMLAVLPLGSGNDFAYALGQSWQKAPWHDWAEQPPRRIDVGQVELLQPDDNWQSRAFINSIGLGIEGAIAALAPRVPVAYGFGRYVVAALLEAWRYRAPHMRLSIDGHLNHECEQLLLAVGNGPRAGGGFLLHPDAVLDDGKLDLCRVGELSRGRRARLLPSVIMSRHHRHPEVVSARVHKVEIDCPTGVPVHCDGEVVATAARRVQIRVQPSALSVLAPSPSASASHHRP